MGTSLDGAPHRRPALHRLALPNRGSGGNDEQSLSVLRELYARGELSDDEFDRRREQLKRSG
ncbi:SHOCT domain-containing protein [Halorubrum lacusprofundi]|uniref:SHOCT domain-containing protein n=1 Tax=Halorubrum lacusprofundi TaxID=2247 RepID=UPI00373AED83